MIRNIIILILLVAVGYLSFQNYEQRVEIHHLNVNMDRAKEEIAKLSHHPFRPVPTLAIDYLARASVHLQRGEDALARHDYKAAQREYSFARLATVKAAAQGLTGQRNDVSAIGQRVGHLADQIKQLGEALRG